MKSFLLVFVFCCLSNAMFAQKNDTVSSLEIYNISTNSRTIVLKEDAHFEAPNWSKDGNFFVINQNGGLYKIYMDGQKIAIDTGFANRCNNDHGISPDGSTLVLSHNLNGGGEGWLTSCIFTVPIGGGIPQRITPNTPSFWHGWSPDGKTLVYTAKRESYFNIYAIPVNGGVEKALTNTLGLDDGPEYSADGRYIYYNSVQSGSMEIWRMDYDGSNKEQLTNDKYSNWFPHPSPDGKYVVYIAYLEDQGSRHPAMKNVALQLYDINNKTKRTLCRFIGGQGSLNVPSWAPDSTRFAFVSYARK